MWYPHLNRKQPWHPHLHLGPDSSPDPFAHSSPNHHPNPCPNPSYLGETQLNVEDWRLDEHLPHDRHDEVLDCEHHLVGPNRTQRAQPLQRGHLDGGQVR